MAGRNRRLDAVKLFLGLRHYMDVPVFLPAVPSEDGNTLNLEVVSVSPPGSSSTYTFKKQP